MRLITWAALFVGGVALGAYGTPGAGLPWASWWLFLGATVALAVALRISGRSTSVGIAGVALLLGLLRGGDVEPQAWVGVPTDRSTVSIEAVLVEDPAPASNAVRLRLQALEVTEGSTSRVADFVFDAYVSRLSTPAGESRTVGGYRYGDRYSVLGAWRTYEEPRDSAGALSAQTALLLGEDGGNPVRRWLADVRIRLAETLQRSMDDRSAGLSAAMLTGDRRNLTQETLEKFRNAGLAHVLAISGLHVAIFGGLALAWSVLLIGRHRRYHMLLPFGAVWGYALLAGMSPSVTRAAIMFSVYLAARALGRQRSVLPALGLAAAVMVALDPAIVGSVSFQLSFAAVFGIAGLARPISGTWQRQVAYRLSGRPFAQRAAMWIGTGLAVSLAATVLTAPIVASTFGAVPLLGSLATLLVLPALPFLIMSAFASATLGMVFPLAGQVAGWPAWLATTYASGVAGVFSAAPSSIVESPPWPGPAAAAYFAVAGVIMWRRQVIRELKTLGDFAARVTPDRLPPRWAAASVAVIAIVACSGALSAGGQSDLRITFFETDVGDAIFIETPSGTQVLVDGGRSTLGAVRSLERVMPFSDRSIDLAILTHGDADHVGGLTAVIERFDVTYVADTPTLADTRIYEDWLQAIDGHPGRVILSGGEIFVLDNNITLEVLSAGSAYGGANDNDGSVVLLLRYGDVAVLLPGDLESRGESALLARGLALDSDVLLAGHHGSRTSSSPRFLDAVSPAAVVISSGASNPYGHPHDDVVERLQSYVCEVCLYRTDAHGDVTFRTDGRRLWVETER